MKGIVGFGAADSSTNVYQGMVSFIAFILLLSTFTAATSDFRENTNDVSAENLVDPSNINDDMVHSLLLTCRAELNSATKTVDNVKLHDFEEYFGSYELLSKRTSLGREDLCGVLYTLNVHEKQILLEHLKTKSLQFSFGEETNSKFWFTRYLESWFNWPDAPRRRELLQSSAEAPAPSPEAASPIHSPEPSSVAAPSAHHPVAPPSLPFFPPLDKDSGLSPSPNENSSGIPNAASHVYSDKQKSSRKTVVVAVLVTAGVTFVLVALVFLCYRRVRGNGAGIGQNDENPLLNLSGYFTSSARMSPVGNPNDKEKQANNLVYSNSNPNKLASSFDKKFCSEWSTAKLESSSGTFSDAAISLPNGSVKASSSPLKTPPGWLGTCEKPPSSGADLFKTSPNKATSSNPSLPPCEPVSSINPLGGHRSSPPEPPIPSGVKTSPQPPLPRRGGKPPQPHVPPSEGRSPPPPPPPPRRGPRPPHPPPPPIGATPSHPPPPPSGRKPPHPPTPPIGGMPPRPPPPQPPQMGAKLARPSPLGPDCLSTSGLTEGNATDVPKAKLKPFFWDKVMANPDHSMVWHQIKSGSFQFNEEMIETLFGYATTEKGKNELKKESSSQDHSTQYIQIIDPKKSQNLSILLKALNVTTEEVCDALHEGDELPSEFLQSVLKMAPTAEEELKLRLYSGELSRLGPAERFLRVLVEIPFAFKRLESLLFMSSLQEEVTMVKESFATLEAACRELRQSRLFLKLLEAVLKTGNRMNDGTFRGGAQAFKLDTLLKLSDVKGTDGKTTLLHFVVQEIIRTEGRRASRGAIANQGTPNIKSNDIKDSSYDLEELYRSIGLQVVSGLGSELENVRKAAALDSDSLAGTVLKLRNALREAEDFLSSDMKSIDKENGFHKTLRSFVQNAEVDVTWLLEEEKRIMTLVKSTADYFHGHAGKDEGLRLFVIVRDFLIILDKVCNEVKSTFKKPTKIVRKEDSTAVTSQSPSDARLLLFPAITGRRMDSSGSDDDSQ